MHEGTRKTPTPPKRPPLGTPDSSTVVKARLRRCPIDGCSFVFEPSLNGIGKYRTHVDDNVRPGDPHYQAGYESDLESHIVGLAIESFGRDTLVEYDDPPKLEPEEYGP